MYYRTITEWFSGLTIKNIDLILKVNLNLFFLNRKKFFENQEEAKIDEKKNKKFDLEDIEEEVAEEGEDCQDETKIK